VCRRQGGGAGMGGLVCAYVNPLGERA